MRKEGAIQVFKQIDIGVETLIAEDTDGEYVLLFENEWAIDWALDKNKGLELKDLKN